MVATSKILTVSYGTFSCTLEGFDEPFSTMKAIAEYFRDLAADDRYFGAEPPTPDAEMLHRIAEREIKRRVDAKISASGVVLRAQGPALPATQPDSQPAADATPSSAPSAAAAFEDDETAVSVKPPAEAETVAQKLMRIRAVAAERSAALSAGDNPDTQSATLPDADLVDGSDAYGDVTGEDFGFDLDLPEPPAIADPSGAGLPGADPQMTAGAEAATDTSLQRILTAEAELAADGIQTPMPPLDDDETDDQDQGTASPPTEGRDDGLSFIQRARAQVIKHRRQNIDPQPVFAPNSPVPLPAQTRATPVPAALSDAAPDKSAARTNTVEEEADAILAKISATLGEPESATAPVAKDEDEDAILANISATLGNTGLEAEDEEDLLRELVAAARSAVARDLHEGRAILEGAAGNEEAALSRLMDEANTQLEGDENRRRFSAIMHLKAAVAATFADRKMKPGDAPADPRMRKTREIDRYRDDLSKVVRPQRADTDDTETSDDAGTRASPLVLVSEQRITRTDSTADIDQPAPPADTNEDDDDAGAFIAAMPSPESAKSFADYADRMGAKDLPDLLEVAAAYTATVEGLPHFSRPQILLKVAHVSDDANYSREDGLRSFGMLLREGKIEKLRRGQFKITDASKYMSGARRA